MTDIQNVLLDILKEFARVAKGENYQWYAMFGTLLGASRHSGFVPWDEDMDVAMPRDNYNKLRESPHLFNEPYFLQTPANDPEAAPRFIRLRRSDTTMISKPLNSYTKGGHMGIYIDIIPLDTVPDYDAAERLQESVLRVNRQMYASAALDENAGEKVPLFKEYDCIVDGGIAGHYQFFAERYERLCVRYDRGRYYSTPVLRGDYGRYIYDKKWFSQTTLMDFEDIKIPVPYRWKEVLVASFPGGSLRPKAKIHSMDSAFGCVVDTKNPYTKYTQRYTNMLHNIDDKEVILFAGGDKLQTWIERYGHGINTICAVNNDESKWGSVDCGLPVKSPKDLPRLLTKNTRLIIASSRYDKICQQLDKMGIHNYYVFIDGLKYRREQRIP